MVFKRISKDIKTEVNIKENVQVNINYFKDFCIQTNNEEITVGGKTVST